MLPAPPTGNPYDYVDPSQPNRGSMGVVKAWDTLRFFWGGTAQQGFVDLVNIAAAGPDLLV